MSNPVLKEAQLTAVLVFLGIAFFAAVSTSSVEVTINLDFPLVFLLAVLGDLRVATCRGDCCISVQ